jgi:putative ABC transport system permease protein
MAIQNFVIAGTIRFGLVVLDRNTVVADIGDMQYALDMENATAEVLGFFPNLVHDEPTAQRIAQDFNALHAGREGDMVPVMLTLYEQNNLGDYFALAKQRIGYVLVTFFIVMSLVLWNAGLMQGIRRYGEIGVRLAIGESKPTVFRRLLAESFVVGLVGSVIGAAIGLGFSYYLQEVGMDISGMMESSNVLMANIMRAKIDSTSYWIGFVPGLLATFMGSVVSGLRIFKRQTAQLFKELEA